MSFSNSRPQVSPVNSDYLLDNLLDDDVSRSSLQQDVLSPPLRISPQIPGGGRLVVAIDYGTTFTGSRQKALIENLKLIFSSRSCLCDCALG